MIVLDTTIMLYAVGADHPLREPSRTMLRELRDGRVRATTTVEVIQEFAHVHARRRVRSASVALATDYVRGLSPLLRMDEDDLMDGLDVFGGAPRLGAFDAVLAAASRRRSWALASADQTFGDVTGLRYLDPSSPHFVDELHTVGG